MTLQRPSILNAPTEFNCFAATMSAIASTDPNQQPPATRLGATVAAAVSAISLPPPPPAAASHLHTAHAAISVYSSLELAVESVMPGIYLTKNFIAWNEQNLRAHGFTHIIIIDKHIQELYYPSPVFKLSTQSPPAHGGVDDPFDCYYAPVAGAASATPTSLSFGKEFEAIDLNFGEKSYLTTVLPNCYRAVKFINKALQAGGTILVIDCNGGEQKCVTIVVAYLMYKHNIRFSNAFERLKSFYKKADLDRFYTSQLYEYEPILQVQRAQSRGHSCSRELHAAILKRKKQHDHDDVDNSGATVGTNEFFDTFNPLSQFNANGKLHDATTTTARTTATTTTTGTTTDFNTNKTLTSAQRTTTTTTTLSRQHQTQQQQQQQQQQSQQSQTLPNQQQQLVNNNNNNSNNNNNNSDNNNYNTLSVWVDDYAME